MVRKLAPLVLLISLIAFGMISFFSKWFSADEQEKTAEDESVGGVESDTDINAGIPALDTAQYSMDFTGADLIMVRTIDYSADGTPETRHQITDSESIRRIIELLAVLPKEGGMMKKVAPGKVTEVIALRDDTPFAYVEFYRNMLKTEDTSFFDGNDETVSEKERELYEFVKID